LAIAEPQEHGFAIAVLGFAMSDVCEIDAGGGEGGSPGAVIADRGVVESAVATTVHLGPQVVASRAKAAELLLDPLGRQVATGGQRAARDASIVESD